MELPVLGATRERADAAANRLRILAAAERLFAAHGPDCVTMDAIAAAAGVGKGTLFRRFGDRAGLAYALLDERERALQERVLSGPPPLGPGAPPAERLAAFLDAQLEVHDDALDVILVAETAHPGARFRVGAYTSWHQHVTVLLREAGRAAPEVLAHVVLAPLAADLQRHLLKVAGVPRENVRAALRELARAVTAPPAA